MKSFIKYHFLTDWDSQDNHAVFVENFIGLFPNVYAVRIMKIIHLLEIPQPQKG